MTAILEGQWKTAFVGIEKWDQTPKGRVVLKESEVDVEKAVPEAPGHAGTLPTQEELEKQHLWIPGGQVR